MGRLGDGDVVRVGNRVVTVTPTIRARPIARRSSSAVAGGTVNVGSSCTAPWGDLDARTHDPDGCSVQLGTVAIFEVTQVATSMDDRQGIAPRFDALRN